MVQSDNCWINQNYDQNNLKNRPPIVWERGIFNSLLFLKLYIYIHTPALKAQIKTLFHLIFIPSSNNKIALANEAFKNNDLPVKFWLIQVSLDNILILLLIGPQNLLWPILCLYFQMRWCKMVPFNNSNPQEDNAHVSSFGPSPCNSFVWAAAGSQRLWTRRERETGNLANFYPITFFWLGVQKKVLNLMKNWIIYSNILLPYSF